MPQITIKTTVVGYLSDVQIWLEGRQTRLGYDGAKTWSTTDIVEDERGSVEVALHGRGVAGTDWELTISELHPAQKQLYDKKGSIKSSGHSFVEDSVQLK